jgi:hypothetical protein
VVTDAHLPAGVQVVVRALLIVARDQSDMSSIESQPGSAASIVHVLDLDAAALPVDGSSATAIVSEQMKSAATTSAEMNTACDPSASSTAALALLASSESETSTVKVSVDNTVTSDRDFEEGCVGSEWDDCTEVLGAAVPEMQVGEMIHPPNFSLFAAMSAIELMEPKMDVGCRPSHKLYETALPAMLSDEELIQICDELLARMATWMSAHTLPQTIFSCAYVQRSNDIPRLELAVYIKVMLATVSIFRHIVSTEQVANEEDFIAFDFGLKLPHQSESNVSTLVRKALANRAVPELTARNGGFNGEGPPDKIPNALQGQRSPIAARLQFLQTLHALFSSMYASRSLRFGHVRLLIEEAETYLAEIRASRPGGTDDVIKHVFDQTYNQHLLANTPPRTAPVLTCAEAVKSLFRQLAELKALTDVKRSLLPSLSPYSAVSSRGDPRKYSFHTLIHGLTYVSARWHPTALSRSLLKRMIIPEMFPGSLVLSVADASMASLLAADVPFTGPEEYRAILKEQLIELTPCASHIVWSLCRNQGRQRRNLIKSLSEWDRGFCLLLGHSDSPRLKKSSLMAQIYVAGHVELNARGHCENLREKSVLISSPAVAHSDRFVSGTKPMGNEASHLTAQDDLAEIPRHLLARSLSALGLEVAVRIMVQHVLLGFECNLYHPSEFATLYFYVGYLLENSSMAKDTGPRGLAGVGDAGTQTPRLALYLLDEARWRLCKATFSILEALQIGRQWSYSWRRHPPSSEGAARKTLPSSSVREFAEELWYEQRFGMMREFRFGPRFLSYETFRSLRFEILNPAALSENENISRLLHDATDSFKAARLPLGRATQLAAACDWNILADEAKALGRVAVMNCIVVSQLLLLNQPTEYKPARNIVVPGVQIKFDEHRHFPVVVVLPRR